MPDTKYLGRVADVLHALAHPVRVGIYTAISIEPLCVCELSTLLRMSPPALMYHLRILWEAGLITVVKSGKFAEYRPTSEGAKEILHLASLREGSLIGGKR
jgi:DNA-binding transcriptional ArsR family regulator